MEDVFKRPNSTSESTNVKNHSNNETIPWYHPYKRFKRKLRRNWDYKTGGEVLHGKDPTLWNISKTIITATIGTITIYLGIPIAAVYFGYDKEWRGISNKIENSKYALVKKIEGTNNLSKKDSEELTKEIDQIKDYSLFDIFDGIKDLSYNDSINAVKGLYHKFHNSGRIESKVKESDSKINQKLTTNAKLKSNLEASFGNLSTNWNQDNLDSYNSALISYEQTGLSVTKYEEQYNQLEYQHEITVKSAERERIKKEKARAQSKAQAQERSQKNTYCNDITNQMMNIVRECSKGCTPKQENDLAVKARVYFETHAKKGKYNCTDRKSQIYRQVSNSLDYEL